MSLSHYCLYCSIGKFQIKTLLHQNLRNFSFVCFQFRCLMSLGFSLQKNILSLFLGTLWNHIRKKTAEFSPLLFQLLLIHFLLLLSSTMPQRGPFTGKSKHLLFKPTVSSSSCPPSLLSHLNFKPLQPTDDSLHSLHLNLHNP